MAGLPSFLGTYKYYYSGSAIDVLGDILEQTEEERNRYTEAEAEKCMTYLLYRTFKTRQANRNQQKTISPPTVGYNGQRSLI